MDQKDLSPGVVRAPNTGRAIGRRAFLAGLGAATALGLAYVRRPAFADLAGGGRLILPQLAADGAPGDGVSLREKIGQMVLVGFRGLVVDPAQPVATDLAEGRGAGVILYDYDVPGGLPSRNIESPGQVRALTAQVRGLAGPTVIEAVDQEGGKVARLSPAHGFPATRSAADLGAFDDTEVTYEAAAAMADTMSSVGLNLNFAPVVDLNVNPENPVIGALGRSFSADPDVVTRQAEAFIRAHHDRGVLCTLKHFPGHGSSKADSHLGFVDVSSTWTETELQPFARIVADGLADVIMTAHIYNSHLDPDYPATLSFATVTGILRRQLGYDGVVISDDMQMAAITQQFGFEVSVRKVIDAGVDILLYGNNLGPYDATTTERVVDLIESLVAQGTISAGRIDLSYQRIMALRSRVQSP